MAAPASRRLSVSQSEPHHRVTFEVRAVRVNYGATRALDDISFDLRPGEVHALVGENGSGKSSLVKVLSGIVRPGRGTVTASERDLRLRRPRDAQEAGIVTVFQETLIAADLSIADNIALGNDGWLRRSASAADAHREAATVLSRLGCDFGTLDRRAGDLSLSEQHQVAIARALAQPWQLLILDEPTSALDVQAREPLFTVVRDAVAAGCCVLYVSHRMEEIEALADRVSILRAGHLVTTVDRAEATHERLVRLMSRQGIEANAPQERHRVLGAPRLVTTGLRLRQETDPIEFTLQGGEAVGLAGLEGHGQVDFLRCLGGWARPAAGNVAVMGADGRTRTIRSGRAAFGDGIAYAPGDRKRDGIFAEMSVVDNLLLPTMRDHVRWGALRPRDYKRAGRELAARARVGGELNGPIGRLSGGNQQKAVIGRWIARTPRVLLLDDPMRGVDVAAKSEIFDAIHKLIDQGAAVVLLSTEVLELVEFCDRVLVFRDHILAGQLAGENLSQAAVLGAMLGMVRGDGG